MRNRVHGGLRRGHRYRRLHLRLLVLRGRDTARRRGWNKVVAERTMPNETAATRLGNTTCGALMTRGFHRERVVAHRARPSLFHVVEPEGVPKGAREVQGGRVHGGGGLAGG